jgi:hypothetical protein
MPSFDQPLDHCDHRGDFLRRVRRDVRRDHAERAHVLQIMSLVALGDHRGVDALLLRGGDDLVVHIGHVARVDEAPLAELVPDQAGKRVEHDRGASIADMRPAVDGRPAHIHGNALGIERNERPLLARHRVVEADHSWLSSMLVPEPLRRVSTQSTTARPLAFSSG